jgi:hypothetical protein
MPKKTLRFSALILFGIYVLYSFVLYPLQTRVGNDAVLNDTFLIYILEFLSPLTECLGLAAAIGFLAYSVYRYGTRNSAPLLCLSAGAILFKSAAYFISYSILKGSLQFGRDGKNTIISLLLTNLVEAVVLAVVVLLAHFETKRAKERLRTRELACKRLGKEPVPESKKILDFKSPFFRAVLFGSLPYVAFRIFLFVSSLLAPFYLIDFYWVIIFFFTSVLVPAVSCFFLSLLCIKLAEREYLRLENEEKEENTEEQVEA